MRGDGKSKQPLPFSFSFKLKFIPALRASESRITPSSLLCLKMNRCSLEPIGTTYTSFLTSYSSKIHQRSYVRRFVRVGYRKGVLAKNPAQALQFALKHVSAIRIDRKLLYPKRYTISQTEQNEKGSDIVQFYSELHISRMYFV